MKKKEISIDDLMAKAEEIGVGNLSQLDLQLLTIVREVTKRYNELSKLLGIEKDKLYVESCTKCETKHPTRYLFVDGKDLLCCDCAFEKLNDMTKQANEQATLALDFLEQVRGLRGESEVTN